MATILGLVPPFVGALIYMLFRPPEYLEDVRERELEIKAMEERLARRGAPLSGLPGSRRGLVSRLPCLHDEAAAVREPQGAAGDALAGLPLLRDAGRDADHDRFPPRRGGNARAASG